MKIAARIRRVALAKLVHETGMLSRVGRPSKGPRVQFKLRIDPALHEPLLEEAARCGLTMNALIAEAIAERLARAEASKRGVGLRKSA